MEKNQLDVPLGAIDKAERAHMTQTGKVLYTAKTHTTGGRENGVARSSDGRLNIRLAIPGSGNLEEVVQTVDTNFLD